MIDKIRAFLKSNEAQTVKVTIGLEGMPSTRNERPEEASQFLGQLVPFKVYSSLDSRHSPYKKSVIISTLLGMLNLPSNAGREIEIETGFIPSSRTPSIRDIISAYTTEPWAAIKLMYTRLLPSTRRAEDVALFHQPVNTIVQAVGLTAELALKFGASFLTYPSSYVYRARPKENILKQGRHALVFTVTLLFWAAAQVLFAAANVVSYTRKIVDAVAQTISTTFSLFLGSYGVEHPKFNVPLKVLFKNIFMLSTLGIPALAVGVESLILHVRNALTGESIHNAKASETAVNLNTLSGAASTKSIRSSLNSTCTKRSISSANKNASPARSRGESTMKNIPSVDISAVNAGSEPSPLEATIPICLSDVSAVRFHYSDQKAPEVIYYQDIPCRP